MATSSSAAFEQWAFGIDRLHHDRRGRTDMRRGSSVRSGGTALTTSLCSVTGISATCSNRIKNITTELARTCHCTRTRRSRAPYTSSVARCPCLSWAGYTTIYPSLSFRHGQVCLIVDCHSFPSLALAYELDQTSERADICIGTDPFHTPPAICSAIVSAAKEEGYSVAVDAPFAGSLVPLASYRKDKRIMSVMIEVNRRLYMDEHSGSKTQNFEKVRAALGGFIVTAAKAAALHQP
jgi:hypothetical protein